MTIPHGDHPAVRKPLRLWPGVAAVLVQWLLLVVVSRILPDGDIIGIIGGVACGAAVAVWWVFFSRAAWFERLGALLLMVAAVFATRPIVDASIAGGMMGMMLPVFSIPVLSLGLVAGLLIGHGRSDALRRASIAICILLASASLALVRTGGIVGAGGADLHMRWTPTPEQRLLARGGDEPLIPDRAAAAVPAPSPSNPEKPTPSEPAVKPEPAAPGSKAVVRRGEDKADEESPASIPAPIATAPEWPGFRGPNRDSVVRGVRIETDWSRLPPAQLWRRPVGPGWSSFAVQGDLLYTQEQRGEDEIVGCYRVSTGEPVWRHRDTVRFWESNGGAGPRATPTLSNGRVYSFGATGILNALDAATGAVIWSRNVAMETTTQVPDWGFASSPLVVDDVVIVAADATLVGYDAASGRQRWVGPTHHGSYSSPHLTTIDGVAQVLLLGGSGVTSVTPATGKVLWEHAWRGVAIVQPAVTADGGVVVNTISAMGGNGTRRLALAHGSGEWKVEERWTSSGLKPYFNDFVVHKGHAYGFDGSILSCINLEDGKRAWKGGRYGSGQLVLLPEQDLLLVLSEEGELALVGATPDQFKEIARAPAIDGKTWNHPALINDVLLVRNGEEMAAFRLSLAGR